MAEEGAQVLPTNDADSNNQASPAGDAQTDSQQPLREASTVPEFETDPKKSRYSLRKAPEEPPAEILTFEDKVNRKKSRVGLKDSEASLVRVDLLPAGDLGPRLDVSGYGAAPRVVEVFPTEDLDDVIEAEELEQIELNIETEAQQQILNFDLSTEYQRPRIDRALEYRKLHMPTRPDGKLFPFCATRTGRNVAKCCSRCDLFREGRKSDFIAFGPGVSAYFKFLKSLGTLFFFVCLMSTPFLIVNVNGGSHFSNHPFPFAQTTLGNLYAEFNKTEFLLLNLTTNEAVNQSVNSGQYVTYTLRLPAFCAGNEAGCVFKRTDLLLAYSLWDAAICLVIIFTINMMMFFTQHETFVYKQKIPKIEDYSIQTTVPENADAKAMQEHFEGLLHHISTKADLDINDRALHDKFHDVYDVQIVESTGNAISLCIKRGFLLKKLARLDAKIKVMRQRGVHESRIAPIEKKHEKVRELIQKLDEKAVMRAENGKALMAFVTFETQEAKMRILHEYDVFWVCGREPKKLKLKEKDVIRVKPAPPPSTLLWENQEVPLCNRIVRLVLAMILFAAILGVTAGLSFITDSNRVFAEVINVVSGDTITRCGGRYDNITILADAAAAAKANGDTACFCDYEFLVNKPDNATDNAFSFVPGGVCADHILSKITSIGKEIGLSFVVFCINIIIFRVVIVTAQFMKFRSVVDREFAVLRAVFLMTFINAAIICLLVNADWGRLTGVELEDIKFADGTTLIQIGRFVDFEPAWYPRVGVELFVIALFNIFAPHVLPMLRYLYHVFERKYFAPFAVSQQVLNEMYIGEEFLLSVRLAQTLMMVFFILMFSSGMPILYFVGLVSVIVSYWLDKFYFVRLVRTPPQFDTALQLWTVKTMEWAVVLHCLIGFWMYSSPRMFPLTDAEARQSLLQDLTQSLQLTAQDAANSTTAAFNFNSEIAARFVRSEAVVMLACAALIVAMKMLRRFGKTALQCASPAHVCMNMLRALVGRQHQLRHLNKYVIQAEHFESAIKNGRVAGVRSYNILANPFYQRVFQMQDGLDDREKSTDTKSGPSSSLPPKDVKETNNYRGYQSLQDALNIRKGTAVSSIEARSIWRDDGKSSVNSNLSKGTSTLYTAARKGASSGGVAAATETTDLAASNPMMDGSVAVGSDARSEAGKSTKSTKSKSSKKSDNAAGAANQAVAPEDV